MVGSPFLASTTLMPCRGVNGNTPSKRTTSQPSIVEFIVRCGRIRPAQPNTEEENVVSSKDGFEGFKYSPKALWPTRWLLLANASPPTLRHRRASDVWDVA